jgi:hypothetical protein
MRRCRAVVVQSFGHQARTHRVCYPCTITGDILVSRGSGFHCAMTSTAGQGSGSKSEDMLTTIMKQLAAMDARLQSMEGRLRAVDSITPKVTALEESTSKLGAQQDTLSSAVERIDLAQTQFAAAADKAAADSRQPTPPNRHHQGSHRRQGRDENEGVKTSYLPHISLSSPSMMGPGIRYHGSTSASGTSRSAEQWNQSASRWPPATSSTTRNSGSIGWSSMVVVRPGHSSSN